MSYTSDKRLYLTSDGKVVEEGDERAATLLVGEGGQISDEQAVAYGLMSARAYAAKHRVAEEREATPQEAPKSADVPAAESEDGSASAKSKAAPANTKAIDAPESNK